MDEFRIITAEKNELAIVHAVHRDQLKFKLPCAESWITKGDFGYMLFNHFKGNGFDIWFSNYKIKKSVKLTGKSDNSVLELHTQYINSFPAKWNEFVSNVHPKQYELTFTPDADTEAEFTGGLQYDTFDIHFDKQTLQQYAEFSPRLDCFLNDVEKSKASQLLNTVRFLTPAMEEVIRSILLYTYDDRLANRFIDGRVHEFLILFIHQLGLLDKMPQLDPVAKKKAEEVMKIILSDFSVYDSVEVLARKVGTTETKLQMAFKQLYGVTVGKFSREERLKKAHEVLISENDILLSVALMVGYNDAGNFSTAFKNYFGYSPGHIQKRLKHQ